MRESSSSNYSYKPYVKNIALDEVQIERRKETGKSFFNNIKAELNNIKNDATKLGSKDAYRPSSINGSYSNTVNLRSSFNANESMENKERKVTLLSNRKECNSSISQYPSNTDVYEKETKVMKLEAKLSQETKKREELFCLLEEEKKNQTFLRDQITRIKDSHANLEKDLVSKNKEIQTLMASNKRELNERGKTIAKLEHDLEINLRNYENFKKSDEQIVEKIVQKDLQISILTEKLNQLENQNKALSEELSQEKSNKDYEIELIIKSYEEKVPKEEEKLSYKELGASFETRINELLEDNFCLKNKVNSLESQIEHQSIRISSLQETVDIYEERDRDQGKGINEHELENLRNKVMELQSENDKLQSDHEFEIMKLENQIDEIKLNGNIKTNESRNLNHILKDQITEIENLKEKLRQKNELAHKNKYY